MGKIHDGVHLDDLSLEILEQIWREDTVTTRDISNSQDVNEDDADKIRYRFRRLDEAGLVEVSDSDKEGRGKPPKEAEITEIGVDAIEQGLLGDVFDEQVSLSAEDELRNELQELRSQVEKNEQEIDRLFAEVEDITIRLKAIYDCIKEELDILANSYINTELNLDYNRK